ncbi:membrane fusion protein, Cu(I)/Ag(I) efflux system [Flagellimonas taeanensis]|uniref:Membrane fusion protein, Cu(I)/Ag(I) efflux system n=1 Tax=Flagellimonas taeanensis TaxID=1005926 RepID=A0A1M6P871_9FLAO|nr:efflux RND transporter periplasmic adaptor subunit [Allomuricauda taeanensis]SFB66413.1 membrane fusion protein, Cu(I)/Ag(I) efflux system [Allomuricauda taeanensis]SHK04113.1 membrane fusion protein, Cu(I)/Ag(I) efflux system [Allomuricauda taeanensis]
MKKENIWYVCIAVAMGLLVGYLIFGTSTAKTAPVEHDHGAEMASEQMWTCSMHPQIMQPELGDCPICGMDLIPAHSSGEGLAQAQIRMTPNAMALAGVETITVGMGSSDNGGRARLSGKVAVNQESDAVQSAYFDGRIEKLNVNFEGEEVKRGQLLATIYAPELVSAQQELITAANLKSTQPALYTAVRNKLKLWKLSNAQIDQIEKSGQVRQNFPVHANVSGVVSGILVEEGDYIKTGSPLVRVANLNTVWAIFDAYENQLALFEKGQILKVNSKAYPNESFDAKISFVDPILNNNSRTLEVRASLDNRKGLLKPGMFVTAEVELSQKVGETLQIPESAVLWTGKRSVVYVKPNPDEAVFEMREVQLGNLVNGNYVVDSGLESGEEIVAKGTFTVDAAAQLQGKKSMMNPSGGVSMTGHEGHGQVNMDMDFPSGMKTDFKGILENYLKLKDALVASNEKEARQFAKKGAEESEKVVGMQMGPKEKTYFSTLTNHFLDMSNESSLVGQREKFVLLSEQMVEIGNQMQGMGQTIYVQKCPMANKNEGANWLSLEKEIRNPYYGEDMLTCGSIVHVIN